ncbi:sodium-dependent transporter [Oceanisphaera arctica]|uniref:Sodium-dependent transporter n=1 Tax=Oceanisphaera arctica TaxID=641510 RepID=A0A2P5TJG7_9GAMM|nr:sodium-dependent transporter [Oceanisphaera arctica]PPL15101.1 sodium-dependent transporter [Oceanisphaera arctica]GHA29894.1 sodium-dependent transporter [Oceanisphaera arctica]
MEKRAQFSSKLGFVMAAAGSAIGVGNIWGFPTQAASNGGGAFLLVYLLFIFLLGYPMLVAEITIGRHGQASPFRALRTLTANPLGKVIAGMVGLAAVITVSLIFTFYAIVSGWFVAYALEPLANLAGANDAAGWLTGFSTSRNLVFTLLFALLSLYVVSRGLEQGIEKWSTRLMPLLLIMMVLLTGYMLSQPGADEGLKAYLVPDFSRVLNGQVLIGALGQSFFSLSLGAAVMMLYGSYLSRQTSIPALAAQVTLLDTGVAFLAGLMILPAMYVAQHNGVPIFAEDGSLLSSDTLVFSVLPALFETMGQAQYPVAFAFFLLMIVAALTSAISMLEAPVSLAMESTGLSRIKATWLMTTLCTLVSVIIVFNFGALFGLVITLTTQYAQPLVSLCITLYAGWVWQRNKVLAELKSGCPELEQGLFWKIWPWYVRFVCPVLVLVVIIQSIGN